MTVFGSLCTQILIDRTLICNAILYHFQITLFCGHINRPFIPLTFFLLSRPLEQLEFIRSSNSSAENVVRPTNSATTIYSYSPTQTPKSISTTSRSLLNFFFKSPMRDDLLINFLVSVFTSYKNFKSVRIQSRKDMFETNIVVIHDQIPQRISLPNPSFLRSRPRSSRHDDKSRAAKVLLCLCLLYVFVLCITNHQKCSQIGRKRETSRLRQNNNDNNNNKHRITQSNNKITNAAHHARM